MRAEKAEKELKTEALNLKQRQQTLMTHNLEMHNKVS
jgi:hypothetical protein